MAVGFELATGWNIYQDKQDSSGQYLKCAKGAVLLTHPSGWKLTADGVEIEFVIDAVQETNVGEAFVKVAFGALRRFIDDLNAKKAQAEVRAADLPRWFPPGKSKFVIIPDGHDIAALPQVTGGIRLARIRRLMRILSDDQSEAAKTFFGNYTAAYTAAMGAVAIPHAQIRDSNWVHVPSAKLRGLVTLIAFYIRQFKTTAPGQSVYAAKYRTVLAGLGDKLDPGPNGEVNYATIIEFRATQKRVPYTEWQNYAIRMYRFIVELNEGTKTAALDLQ